MGTKHTERTPENFQSYNYRDHVVRDTGKGQSLGEPRPPLTENNPKVKRVLLGELLRIFIKNIMKRLGLVWSIGIIFQSNVT